MHIVTKVVNAISVIHVIHVHTHSSKLFNYNYSSKATEAVVSYSVWCLFLSFFSVLSLSPPVVCGALCM